MVCEDGIINQFYNTCVANGTIVKPIKLSLFRKKKIAHIAGLNGGEVREFSSLIIVAAGIDLIYVHLEFYGNSLAQ